MRGVRAAWARGPQAAAEALRAAPLLASADPARAAAAWVARGGADMEGAGDAGDADGADGADGGHFLANDFAAGVRALCARVRRSCGEEVDADQMVWAEGAPDAEVVAALAECARAVRNLCVNEDAQEVLFDALAVDLAHVARVLPRLHDSSPFEPWRDAVLVLGRVLTQALANLCVGSPDHAARLWQEDGALLAWVAGLFRLAIVRSDLALLRNLAGLLYGLVLVDRAARAAELAAHEAVSVHLLHSAVLALTVIGDLEEGAEQASDHDAGSAQPKAPVDPVAADLHANLVWLVGELINAGQGRVLLESVRNAEQTDQLKPVLISLWLGHRLEEENASEDERPVGDAPGMEASFDALAAFYIAEVQARQPALERTRAEQLALRALGSYAQDNRVFRLESGKRDLLHAVLGELDVTAANKELVDFGVRVDLLRVVANACFRRASNQDAVRDYENGLFIVLNQCNVDERSPFLREWGIVAIRNLCEGNEENQRVIADLRVQGAVQTSVLDKAGLRVELGQDGKPKVVPNKVS